MRAVSISSSRRVRDWFLLRWWLLCVLLCAFLSGDGGVATSAIRVVSSLRGAYEAQAQINPGI